MRSRRARVRSVRESASSTALAACAEQAARRRVLTDAVACGPMRWAARPLYAAPVGHRVADGRRVSGAVLVDVALAVGVFAVIAVAIAADLGTSQDRSASVVAFLIAAGLGLLMLARRQAPVLVLVATAVGLLAYYTAGYPPVGLALPVAAALFSAAEAARLWWSVGVGAALLLVSFVARAAQGQDVAYLLGYELVITVALMAAAIALGYAVAAGRARRAV